MEGQRLDQIGAQLSRPSQRRGGTVVLAEVGPGKAELDPGLAVVRLGANGGGRQSCGGLEVSEVTCRHGRGHVVRRGITARARRHGGREVASRQRVGSAWSRRMTNHRGTDHQRDRQQDQGQRQDERTGENHAEPCAKVRGD